MAKDTGTGLLARPLAVVNQLFQQYNQQLFQPPRAELADMPLDGWGSPLQPIKPLAPAGSEPYRYPLYPGQNLIFTPRPDASYTALDLMAMSTYPLVRICIENVKDILTSADKQVMLKPRPGESRKDAAKRSKGDEVLLKLNRFFDRPDREHDWGEWFRELCNDMLVGDWAAVLIRKTRGGQIVEIPRIGGYMIQRIVDKNGFTPLPPDPAYAQIWWGIPRVDLTTEQLIYKPRNIVERGSLSSNLYGYPPVEQLGQEIEIGIQRLMFVQAYYTEGSIPGMLQVVPRGTPPDKIQEAMAWMNSELAGNLAKRRQLRIIQGWTDNPKDENIQQTKEALLSDPYDDQHVRRICFGIGTSAQRLLKQMNRASAEQADDAADIEGTRPYFVWAKGLCDYIIQVKFAMTDYEMVFDPSREPDIKKEMETVTGYVKGCIKSPNEARESLDLDPVDDPLADKLGTLTANGWTPIELLPADAQVDEKGKITRQPTIKPDIGARPNGAAEPQQPAAPPKPAGGKPNGAEAKAQFGFVGPSVSAARGAIVFAESTAKASAHDTRRAVIHPGRMSPRSIEAKHHLERALKDAFRKMQKTTVRLLRRYRGIAAKAASDEDVATREILEALAARWEEIADAAESDLQDAALVGADNAALQLDITSEDVLSRINETARNYASRRAAEMIGMRRTADGELVENPDARWAITDTTRDKLRRVVENVFSGEAPTLADIEQQVMDAGIYSDDRASMIARTEVANAQVNANLLAWQESGMVEQVSWQTSADHDADDICDDNEDESPYDVNDVPDFPAHPNCQCVLVLERLAGEEEE